MLTYGRSHVTLSLRNYIYVLQRLQMEEGNFEPLQSYLNLFCEFTFNSVKIARQHEY